MKSFALFISRMSLGASALLHLYFGAAFAIDPLPWMQRLSLSALNAAGLAEMRAFYGGLMLAMGALFAWAALHKPSLKPGLVMMTVTYFGAALVRGISLTKDGVADALLWNIWAIEGTGVLAGLICLVLLNRSLR